MKALYDEVSQQCSRFITRTYSTSFSMGIYFLDKKLRQPIYSIYGFVRLADEIVDTFGAYDQEALLGDFRRETFRAIANGLSVNPVLHSFQETVNRFNIEPDLIETFLDSMAMDLERQVHDLHSFQRYILGSAEVVGLMCLWVFCEGNGELYERLKKPAMHLGSAFQKVNFLRDLNFDYNTLHRVYFPDLEMDNFTGEKKAAIEGDIRADFSKALEGIKCLPRSARFGVYVAYAYYLSLLAKIERYPAQRLLSQRLRLPSYQKLILLVRSFFSFKLGIL